MGFILQYFIENNFRTFLRPIKRFKCAVSFYWGGEGHSPIEAIWICATVEGQLSGI